MWFKSDKKLEEELKRVTEERDMYKSALIETNLQHQSFLRYAQGMFNHAKRVLEV